MESKHYMRTKESGIQKMRSRPREIKVLLLKGLLARIKTVMCPSPGRKDNRHKKKIIGTKRNVTHLKPIPEP